MKSKFEFFNLLLIKIELHIDNSTQRSSQIDQNNLDQLEISFDSNDSVLFIQPDTIEESPFKDLSISRGILNINKKQHSSL